MFQFIDEIDKRIIDFIYNHLQYSSLNKPMEWITLLGNDGVIWMFLICILMMLKKYRKMACTVAFAFLLSRMIGAQILKPLIHRPRPFLELTYIDIFISKPTSYSFPSCHAISAFASTGVIVKMIKQKPYKIFFIAFAFLLAFSRLYLMVHYLSDILAGIILGLICSKIALYFSGGGTLTKVKEKTF